MRGDVLVYTSPVLEEDLEVIGPVEAVLYAATDGPDTDFTAKLVDVSPGGYAMNLCDGIRRGRYRESREREEMLEPGKVYEYRIEVGVTANVFRRGHRIRLEVSSSNFPRFDRNPNTGNPYGMDAELRRAQQDRPSLPGLAEPAAPARGATALRATPTKRREGWTEWE